MQLISDEGRHLRMGRDRKREGEKKTTESKAVEGRGRLGEKGGCHTPRACSGRRRLPKQQKAGRGTLAPGPGT